MFSHVIDTVQLYALLHNVNDKTEIVCDMGVHTLDHEVKNSRPIGLEDESEEHGDASLRVKKMRSKRTIPSILNLEERNFNNKEMTKMQKLLVDEDLIEFDACQKFDFLTDLDQSSTCYEDDADFSNAKVIEISSQRIDYAANLKSAANTKILNDKVIDATNNEESEKCDSNSSQQTQVHKELWRSITTKGLALGGAIHHKSAAKSEDDHVLRKLDVEVHALGHEVESPRSIGLEDGESFDVP
ncbi:unnamed protein product [Dovyalis caffra]|uniref:Uncharacterized protein n=1 Tax=Dovyalis caffra TaxID=77055 RepID=A0AAV1RGT8_9ROSI|nr:unnamed protein product [Dovyalis caffra]